MPAWKVYKRRVAAHTAYARQTPHKQFYLVLEKYVNARTGMSAARRSSFTYNLHWANFSSCC
jgi:hypothetical protein